MTLQWRRRISLALTPLLLLMLFAVPGSASGLARSLANDPAQNETAPADPIAELWTAVESLRAEQKLLGEQIAAQQGTVSFVVDEKKLLDEQISLFYRELACLDTLLRLYDDLLSAQNIQQDALDASIDQCGDRLANRLRQAHEEGTPGLLELLAASPDVISFLIALERQSQLEEYDRKLMDELNGLYEQQDELLQETARLKEERHEVTMELANRTRVFNQQLQVCGGFLWNLQTDVHRFSYFIQQSQAGIQHAEVAIQSAADAFAASLSEEKRGELEALKQDKLALFSDQIKGQMDAGLLQLGSEFSLSGSRYILPLVLEENRSPAITSVMGYCTYQIGDKVMSDYHGGIDLSAAYGTSVVASASGVVIATGWQNGYGNYVVLWHEDGSQTRYAHLSQINVSLGDYLLQGEELGIAGSSGNSKGIGCHFELWQDGKRVDPADLLIFSAGE